MFVAVEISKDSKPQRINGWSKRLPMYTKSLKEN